jgi:hypothetical protein
LWAFDRLSWGWLSRIWVDWKSALRIVKPETVIAWLWFAKTQNAMLRAV